MPARKKGQAKRAAKTVTKKTSFRMVEITIEGESESAYRVGEALTLCYQHASNGVNSSFEYPTSLGPLRCAVIVKKG